MVLGTRMELPAEHGVIIFGQIWCCMNIHESLLRAIDGR